MAVTSELVTSYAEKLQEPISVASHIVKKILREAVEIAGGGGDISSASLPVTIHARVGPGKKKNGIEVILEFQASGRKVNLQIFDEEK